MQAYLRDLTTKTEAVNPLHIAVLNLMPLKEDTETDLINVLSNSPYEVELDLMRIASHESKHCSSQHMERFYRDFEDMREEAFDGFIVTGAPLEHLPFEEVTYWESLCEIFDWARERVKTTLYICWAAQAALYHFYGIKKYPISEKLFGIFPHRACAKTHPLLGGLDDVFFVPHSRHTEIHKDDVLRHKELRLLSESEEAGVHIIAERDRDNFFITGHSEYSVMTLDREYRRDLGKGLPIHVPENYYPGDNPDLPPRDSWRSAAVKIYTNWVTEFVV